MWSLFHFLPQKKKRVRGEKKKEPVTPAPTEAASQPEDVFQIMGRDDEADTARAELEARLRVLEQQEAQEMNELDEFTDNYGPGQITYLGNYVNSNPSSCCSFFLFFTTFIIRSMCRQEMWSGTRV